MSIAYWHLLNLAGCWLAAIGVVILTARWWPPFRAWLLNLINMEADR